MRARTHTHMFEVFLRTSPVDMNVCICVCMNVCICVCMYECNLSKNTPSHKILSSLSLSLSLTHTHTHKRTNTHTHMCTHCHRGPTRQAGYIYPIHTCIHAYMHTHTYTCALTAIVDQHARLAIYIPPHFTQLLHITKRIQTDSDQAHHHFIT